MEKLTDIKNHKVLREKFLSYWTSDNLNHIEGTATDKAFLVYVKGFVDGINFMSEKYKQLKEHK